MENTKILVNGKPFNLEEQGFVYRFSLSGKLNLTKDSEVSFYTKEDKIAILTREIDGSVYSLVVTEGNQGVQHSQDDLAQIRKDIDAAQGILTKYRQSI